MNQILRLLAQIMVLITLLAAIFTDVSQIETIYSMVLAIWIYLVTLE